MKFVLRLVSNALAFYLALYLVDSLVAPRFWIRSLWIAPLLAVLLAVPNSLVRPLPKLKTKPRRALTAALLTMLANAFVLQIVIWVGATLTATSFLWVLITAAFLTLLAGLINWLIGFKEKEKPKVITRELRASHTSRDREVRAPRAGG